MGKMKPCKVCGTEVSKTAEACPKCGAVLKRKTGCLGQIVISLGVLFIGGIWLTETSATKREERVAAVNATPISSITLADLEPIFCSTSDKTDLQKKEIWKQYEGKKVKWSGTVSMINERLQMGVKMKRTTLTYDALVTLKDSEKEKALKLKEGDAVTFTGVLVDWGTILYYSLRDGEIVSDGSEEAPKPNATSAGTTGTKTYGSNDVQEIVLKNANEGFVSAQVESGRR